MSQKEEQQQVNEGGGGEIEPPPQLQPYAGNAPPIETGAGQIPSIHGPPILRDSESTDTETEETESENDEAGEEVWAPTTILPNENETEITKAPEQEEAAIMPIYIYTAIFGVIFLLGPLLVRRGPNIGITRCCIMISAFCCWIFWVTTYIVQLNPLLGPRLSNETLAWIGYKWGQNPAEVADTEYLGGNNTTSADLLMRRSYDTKLSSNLTAVLKD